jgi:hypothetical protein
MPQKMQQQHDVGSQGEEMEEEEHVVMYLAGAGDSLASVAAALGVTPRVVAEANPGLTPESQLQPHDCLALPVPAVLPRCVWAWVWELLFVLLLD